MLKRTASAMAASFRGPSLQFTAGCGAKHPSAAGTLPPLDSPSTFSHAQPFAPGALTPSNVISLQGLSGRQFSQPVRHVASPVTLTRETLRMCGRMPSTTG